MNISRIFCGTLVIASLSACGGGGGGGGGDDSPAPAATSPTSGTPTLEDAVATPTSVLATQEGIRFSVSSDTRLDLGRLSGSITMRLNGVSCATPSLSVSSGTTVAATCDAPVTPGTANLQVFMGSTELTNGGVPITIVDPATQPAPAFTTPTITGSATWGQKNASIVVTGGQNLIGRTFSATVDGVPCTSAIPDTVDLSRLTLKCNTPPGGSDSTPVKVVVSHEGNDLTAGGISHAFGTCAASGITFDGVTLPRLCNADSGSLAAKRIDTIGTWRNFSGNPLLLSPTGRFMAPQTVGFRGGDIAFSNGTWQMANAEDLFLSSTPSNLNGTHTPFVSITNSAGTFKYENYDIANALAVTQSNLTGQWGNSGTPLSLTIAANGNFTGTTSGTSFGTCSLTGSITEAQAGLKHNLFNVQIKAATNAACKLLQNVNVPGLASLLITNQGTSSAPDYKLTLVLAAHQPATFYMVASALRQ